MKWFPVLQRFQAWPRLWCRERQTCWSLRSSENWVQSCVYTVDKNSAILLSATISNLNQLWGCYKAKSGIEMSIKTLTFWPFHELRCVYICKFCTRFCIKLACLFFKIFFFKCASLMWNRAQTFASVNYPLRRKWIDANGATTFSPTTLSIKGWFVTLSINDNGRESTVNRVLDGSNYPG